MCRQDPRACVLPYEDHVDFAGAVYALDHGLVDVAGAARPAYQVHVAGLTALKEVTATQGEQLVQAR